MYLVHSGIRPIHIPHMTYRYMHTRYVYGTFPILHNVTRNVYNQNISEKNV